MIVMTCVDDDMGMLFNKRRQSKDIILRKRILEITAGKKLWMNHYSVQQFADEDAPQIYVEEGFLREAADGDYCFVETEPIQPYAHRIDKLILFHWNRKYPSDLKFDIDLHQWQLIETEDFVGNSHDRITEEVYVK